MVNDILLLLVGIIAILAGIIIYYACRIITIFNRLNINKTASVYNNARKYTHKRNKRKNKK